MSKGTLSSFTQARMRGMDMAAREHSFLKLDLSQRIDIFAVLQQRRVWVMFQPLDALYGAYSNQSEATAGILINVKHPPSLQRFTAAHEYGHAVLQHGISCDCEENIFPLRRWSTIQEVEAQTFAAHFLMPIELVNRTLKHMGQPLKPETMSEHDVYQLSLRLGASYLAVVNHLVSLKKIDPSVGQILRRKQPKDMKSTLKQGSKLTNSWADVWMIDERDHGQPLTIGLDDQVHLYLPEHDYTQNLQVKSINGENPALQLASVNMEMATRQGVQVQQQLVYVQHFVLSAEAVGDVHVYVEGKQREPLTFRLQVKVEGRHMLGILDSQRQYL
jgi:Zn-dependent peptidase ImmA (M78 family)